MNSCMTEERLEIVRQYVHDMINSFVEDPQGADYHDDFDPPYVSFYSPDIERLLEKTCYRDLYSLKYPDFGMEGYYDIDGHRVNAIKGTINIVIDGVTFDQLELDSWLGLAKASKFHMRLPTKPK